MVSCFIAPVTKWYSDKLVPYEGERPNQLSVVSASALLGRFEKLVVRSLMSQKTHSTLFRFPWLSYLEIEAVTATGVFQ